LSQSFSYCLNVRGIVAEASVFRGRLPENLLEGAGVGRVGHPDAVCDFRNAAETTRKVVEAAHDPVAVQVVAGAKPRVFVEQPVQGGAAGGDEAVEVAGAQLAVVQMRFDDFGNTQQKWLILWKKIGWKESDLGFRLEQKSGFRHIHLASMFNMVVNRMGQI
jgi:hypothetical protein